MRFVVTLAVFLGLCGWVLAHWPLPASRDGQPEQSWRRTAGGWERVERWPNHPAKRTSLNPLVVGALQLGLSATALMAGADAERRRQQQDSRPAALLQSRVSTQEHVTIDIT